MNTKLDLMIGGNNTDVLIRSKGEPYDNMKDESSIVFGQQEREQSKRNFTYLLFIEVRKNAFFFELL